MNRVLVARLCVLVGILAVTLHIADQLVIVRGASVAVHLLIKAPGPIHAGDYVRLWIRHPILGAAPAQLTKHVACMPGDRLRFEDGVFVCNDTRLVSVLTETWDHRSLPRFRFEGRIPPGQLFVLGEHPRSFDSRYFGFVDAASVQRLVALF